MLVCLTAKGLSDAQIQLIPGHESKKSHEVYQHMSLESVEKAYEDALPAVGICRPPAYQRISHDCHEEAYAAVAGVGG